MKYDNKIIPICFRIASRILQTIKRLSTTDKAESIRLKTFDISLLKRMGIAIALAINPVKDRKNCEMRIIS